jgi:hypothetical protein
VIYAKAESHASRQAAVQSECDRILQRPAPESHWEGDRDDAQLELKIRGIAIPAALILAHLAVSVPLFRVLLRVFCSMWIHEFGHAITAWLCGFGAFPGPWFTPVWESRSPLVSLLVAGSIAAAGYRAWAARRWAWVATLGGLILIQLWMTLGLSIGRAQAIITFGGDGGCMVLGSCLMASMYAHPESSLHRGWLRWGFLVIGAASFADSFQTWWAAKLDMAAIPFGMNEGMGLSDASKLVDVYGWTETQLVHRYVALGIACLILLAISYAVNLWRARVEVLHPSPSPMPTD